MELSISEMKMVESDLFALALLWKSIRIADTIRKLSSADFFSLISFAIRSSRLDPHAANNVRNAIIEYFIKKPG